MINSEIKVEGMSCQHCVMAVNKAVKALAGVESVEVSLENKLVAVQYDENLSSLESIYEAIEDQGYDIVN
ncbi:MAG: copper chaperone CopZ [Spirochaetales bacterium]|nr:copper chaperone CopZ [Spirochaetales bacterium]